jgi:hypothetical protein
MGVAGAGMGVAGAGMGVAGAGMGVAWFPGGPRPRHPAHTTPPFVRAWGWPGFLVALGHGTQHTHPSLCATPASQVGPGFLVGQQSEHKDEVLAKA